MRELLKADRRTAVWAAAAAAVGGAIALVAAGHDQIAAALTPAALLALVGLWGIRSARLRLPAAAGLAGLVAAGLLVPHGPLPFWLIVAASILLALRAR